MLSGLANNPAEIIGGWRLRPTTLPYMMKDVFPQLLGGTPAPVRPDIWEISRFAVDEERADQPGFGFQIRISVQIEFEV